jgi:hypothetical protein
VVAGLSIPFRQGALVAPYTADTLDALAERGIRTVDVACPASPPIAWKRWKKSPSACAHA